MDYGRTVQFGVFLGSLTVEHGMDPYLIGSDDLESMRRFASDVAPRVRDAVANSRAK